MKKLLFLLVLCLPLLAGCWDEVGFRDLQVVTLIGIEGEKGDVTVHFSFPAQTDDQVEFLTDKAQGKTFSDARNDINLRTSEVIDISQLEVILIDEETAETNLIEYLDNVYRTPRNRLSSVVALTRGDMESFMKAGDSAGMTKNVPTFIKNMLKTSEQYSLSTNHNVQQTGTLIFAKGKDVVLPVIVIGEESGHPELAGSMLFRGKASTGVMLTPSESKVMAIMEDNPGKFLRGTYELDIGGETEFVTVEYIKGDHKWTISGDTASLTYSIQVEIDEFPKGPITGTDLFNETERQVSEQLKKDMEELVNKLQEAGSDPIGIGRHVRAFHPEIWNQGDWHDTFSEMDIQTDVKVTIKRTGILN